MKRKLTFLSAAFMLLAFLAIPLGMRGQTTTLVSGSGTSGYSIPDGWTSSGTVAGGSYLKFDEGTITSPEFTPYDGLSFTYSVATFGSGTNHPLTIRILNASTNEVIVEATTDTPTSSTYINTGSPLSLGDVTVAFKIQMYGPTGKGVRLRNYSVTGTPAGDTPSVTYHTLAFSANPTVGGTVTVGNTTLAEGATTSVSATANTGYVFDSWTVEGEESSVDNDDAPSTTFTMGTENAILTANFTQVTTYTVTYHANVTGIDDIEMVYNEGEDVTVANNTFSNPGHAFVEWNTNENGEGDSYAPGDVISDIESNINLYAQWEESNETVDVLNWEATGSPTNYTDWTYSAPSGAAYAGQSSGSYQSIQLRSNNNNSGIVTTASAGNVTKVTVTWNSNTASGRTLNVYGKNSAYSAASDLYGNNAGTLIGTIVCGTSTELNITDDYEFIGVRSASGAMYLNEIDITWSTGGTPAPSIAADNVEIAYDATSGSITYTINNGVDGGILTAATESDWLTIGTVGETVPFTCSANEAAAARTATVTLTYTYNNSETVTKDVTVTQAGDPNVTPTIAEVRAQGTGDVVTKGIVTSCVGTTGYIQDATAAICVYGTSLTVGDEIRVSGSLSTYHGLLEITNPEYTVISQGNTINPELMTIAEALASTNQGWYIRIEEATVSEINNKNVTIAQGDNTIVVYFNSTDDITFEADDVISLNGNIGCYNTTQIANPQNVEVQAAPAEPSITLSTYSIEATAEETEGALDITYLNLTITDASDFEIQYYDAQGEEIDEPDWISSEVNEKGLSKDDAIYEVTYVIAANNGEARTAYFKVYAFDDETNLVYSNIVTINQAEYVAPALDYAELPFSFDGGRNDIETTDGLTQEGLDSDYNSSPKLKFNSTGDWVILKFNERPGTLAFDIKGNTFSNGTFTVQTSEDGVTYTDLEAYTELGNSQHEEFTNLGENVRYIKWIYTEKVSGNVALGNITLAAYVEPVLVPSITVDPATVNVDAEEHEGTLDLTFENLTITEMSDFDIQYYNAEGQEAETPDWIEVLVAEQDPQIGEGYVVSYYMIENDGEARTAYFKVYALNGEELVYSNLVTVTQEEYVAPVVADNNFVLFTGELVEGDYVVYYDGYAMKNTVENNRLSYEEVTPLNDVITTADASIIWHIAPIGNYWTIYNSKANAYAASTVVKNKAQMLEDGTDDKALWIVDGTEVFEFVNKANSNAGVNANLRNNGTYGFACYATSTGGALTLYKRDVEPETYTLDITGYGDNEGGYYLIASPVYVNPETTGMTQGDFDLYWFDQNQAEEWRNYEAKPFNLVPGKGYLYAHKTDTILTFAGTPYSGDGTIKLVKNDDAVFSGWNLVGNPFGVAAEISADFYTTNPNGDELIPGENYIVDPMQGVFVIAENAESTVIFQKAEDVTSNTEAVVLNVMKNRGNVIDRAIVRFGEGRQLPKFQLNENNTKVYIPQGAEDFAVVRSANQNEMPVNFKAKENGSYTFSVNAENLNVAYLHLIDNMTGADIDLLLTPSYTFEANAGDNANRFRLVFNVNNGIDDNTVSSNASFAYFNGSEWVISNTGNATLQVVDMMGRVLSTEAINGNTTVKVNQVAGVYMLRLVNGNDVKVQKMVVK